MKSLITLWAAAADMTPLAYQPPVALWALLLIGPLALLLTGPVGLLSALDLLGVAVFLNYVDRGAIGIAAPILLVVLRIAQGIGVGGVDIGQAGHVVIIGAACDPASCPASRAPSRRC